MRLAPSLPKELPEPTCLSGEPCGSGAIYQGYAKQAAALGWKLQDAVPQITHDVVAVAARATDEPGPFRRHGSC